MTVAFGQQASFRKYMIFLSMLNSNRIMAFFRHVDVDKLKVNLVL
jgi:hypothetical protein